MQTFLIQSRGIEALHYNADVRLLLIPATPQRNAKLAKMPSEGSTVPAGAHHLSNPC
ncbi:hypothetical protein [Rhizobium laguerreae]|uniref:hypothetical protein n=1 Tax=Rhizobium laguerreae TaxID=1076926 RepID=UPI001441BC12|nr:hypothetical protein [Rhizobium laguerreae]